MRNNVFITVRERGKIRERREGHNIFTDNGREWLASLLGFSQFSPDTPERSDRITYVGVGIGGTGQTALGLANAASMLATYPAGYDPSTTSGNEYNSAFPASPPITTLERPVKLTGSTADYSSAPLSDVWLVGYPALVMTHLSPTEATVHASLGASDVVLGGHFSAVPLSEVGLMTDGAGVSKNSPYSPVVGYHTFGTIQKTADTTIELIWSIRF